MDELIEDLKRLKKGALFTLLSQILVVIAIALVLSTVGWLPMGSYRSPEIFYTEVIYKLMGIMILLVGLFVASAILGLVGFILLERVTLREVIQSMALVGWEWSCKLWDDSCSSFNNACSYKCIEYVIASGNRSVSFSGGIVPLGYNTDRSGYDTNYSVSC